MDGFKLYWHSMCMLMKSRLQYPLSFFLQTLAQIVMQGGELLAVLLIIDRFDTLNQWSGGDLLFFFGLMSVIFYLTECFARGVTCFPPLVQQGKLDTFLLRPRGVLAQALCYQMDPRRVGTVAVGAATMLMGAAQAQVAWTGLKLLALLEAVAAGGVMIMGLFLIDAMLSIHSVKSIEVVNVLTYGGRSACQYPLDIYPKPLKTLFLFVAPFGLTVHAPAAYILGKNLFGWPDWTAFVTPLSGPLFFGAMYLLFQRAMRYYRSTGS